MESIVTVGTALVVSVGCMFAGAAVHKQNHPVPVGIFGIFMYFVGLLAAVLFINIFK